jgi:hypothetical protein
MRIFEYFSPLGIFSTEVTGKRMTTPRAGDLIEDKGMIESVDEAAKTVHICHDANYSAHMTTSGTVDISGGPWQLLKLSDIEPTMGTGTARFWSWDAAGRGAGMGVHFQVERPIFRIIKKGEH